MPKLTWLGDSDPEANDITLYGMTFVKGEAVNVTDKSIAEKLEGHPLFSTDAKAEMVPADEPTADEVAARADAGTVKAALRERLRELGVTVQGNPSEDTLRQKLAEATK